MPCIHNTFSVDDGDKVSAKVSKPSNAPTS